MTYPEGYTQADKKREMANKMTTKYQMYGPGKQGGVGMKFRGNGKNSGRGKGQIPRTVSTGGKGSVPEKTPQGDKKPLVNRGIYTQNGK